MSNENHNDSVPSAALLKKYAQLKAKFIKKYGAITRP